MNDKTQQPRFELVGPTVTDDVERLIARYGKTNVRNVVLELTKEKRGRRAEKDLPKLKPEFERDARDWLEGRDPIALRSHYALAQEFAQKYPGHSQFSTAQRVMRKLARNREWIMLVTAHEISRAEYPYEAHLRAIEALANLEGAHPVWAKLLQTSKKRVERYLSLAPNPPQPLTMAEIENPTNALLSPALLALQPKSSLRPKGLFGAAFRKPTE